MAEVRLHQVAKSYDGRSLAVHSLDLICPQGQMLALLGPSGCGKSSTLKMIAGIETVTSGEILFDDVNVTALDSAGRNIAMVFEDYSLYPHMTAYENIAFPLRVRKTPPQEVARKVSEAIDLLGLQSVAGVPVRTLSGGAQQRVSIGRALVRKPALVMFDEPLSHLDADQKVMLRTEIRRLQTSAGLTSVLVTHDQTEAMAMADRIAVMNHGVLQQIGSPRELYDDPSNLFVAAFIGESPMNFFPASISAGSNLLRLEEAAESGIPVVFPTSAITPSSLTLGIRPEDIRLQARIGEQALALRAEMLYRECCGDRDVLLMEHGPRRFNVEVPSPASLRPGDQVTCYLPLDRLHGFDSESGVSLKLRSAAC